MNETESFRPTLSKWRIRLHFQVRLHTKFIDVDAV